MLLKKVSAALIAASMLAAPAMAAGTKTETAPITKPVAPEAKLQANKLQAKPGVRNANAAMTHHHYRYHRHHPSHLSAYKAGKVSAHKANKVSKVTIKQPGAATRRG